MTTVYVADIASYQAGLDVALLRPDCVGVLIKCTQGNSYIDPDYAAWLAQAKAAGLLVTAYHYVTGDDPAAQAVVMAAHIVDKTLPVMLDAELGSGNLDQVLAVADAMDHLGLRVRLLYLPRWYWAEIGSPDLSSALATRNLLLIQADYPSTAAGSPAGLYPGDDSALWDSYGEVSPSLLQFTDTAVEGGQHVDMSAFRGSAAQLAALLGIDVAPPPAGTAPEWPGRTFIDTPGHLQMIGADVRTWQQRMALRGWHITVDGQYGPESAAVCRAFQTEFHTSPAPGLAVDGQVGIHTWTGAWAIPVTR